MIKNLSIFRAFKSKNFTVYFFGRSFSQFGTWMQRTAVIWVVYSITKSEFMVGVTFFAEQFPSFLFSTLGGVVADRYNRYKIINLTQIISMAQAGLLAVLVFTGHYVVWEILTLSVMLGIVNAFDVPARQSMIHEVVHNEEDLPSALSLSASMASLAKLLGPALSGIILAAWGAGVCFVINALSFGGVMLSIALMKLPVFIKHNKKRNVFAELKEGFVYLKQQPGIGLVIIMISVTALLLLPYDTLLPVFAKEIFNGNAATYGYITSFIGGGAVAGTIVSATLKKGSPLRKTLLLSTGILALGLIGFSLTKNFAVAMCFALITGFGSVAQITISNIIIQSESAPNMRGRAISIFLTALFGMMPLGSLILGAVSEKTGPSNTLLGQGILGIVITIIFSAIFKKKQQNKNAIPQEEMEAEAALPEKV